MRILITGGAGFVGCHLARQFKSQGADVSVIDNLRRRGSEINLETFKKLGVHFHHGDIRKKDDLHDLPGTFDFLIEASAEPSVLAGLDGSPQYVLDTNLGGTLNCLEYARQSCGGLIFLSTSRVYSIQPLREIHLRESDKRFEIENDQSIKGVSTLGISESFPTHLPRSFYGATKLASELIIQEYVDTYGMKAVINRCGVIAGPGQFGKVDQGVFTYWVAAHLFDRPLSYTGFGGKGLQVRDLLHPTDLYRLIKIQMDALGTQNSDFSGQPFNIGGGQEVSVSMRELTELCRSETGKEIEVKAISETNSVDIPLYITDTTKAQKTFSWKPERSVKNIIHEISEWIRSESHRLKDIF